MPLILCTAVDVQIGTSDVDDAVLAALFLLAALRITFAAPVDPANH
ncbi:hypothetical protein T4D_6190 [Trichinella pseudospiralis]|uniref:Uncharacterized protein n=1 Tax=Trichinella pseudospiralis TaxID=6337 RepID=A0A0V1FQC0_TRIPS|nr:hypothetical protein T4D_6190 [Trichinella pseudospiralis]